MDEQATIQEKEGRKYFLLADKTEVLIENEVINDPVWVGIDLVPQIIGLKDRQIRYKIKKLGWLKKYASINGKPALFLNRAQLEQYVKENPRTTTASLNPSEPSKETVDVGEEAGDELLVDHAGTEKGVKVFKGNEQFETMLKTISPHIKEFVESHKKDQDRLRELEDKKSILVRNTAILMTSLFWVLVVSIVGGIILWNSRKELLVKLNEMSAMVSSKDDALSQANTSLIEKDTELKTYKDILKFQNAVVPQQVGQGTK
jgi:ribosomal protein S15P/S13E